MLYLNLKPKEKKLFIFFGLNRMADTLKARAEDIKRRADEHHEALKESNRALWDMIEAARARGLGSGASGYGAPGYGAPGASGYGANGYGAPGASGYGANGYRAPGYGYSATTPNKLVTVNDFYTKYNYFNGGNVNLWKDIYGPYYETHIPPMVSNLTKVSTTKSYYLKPSDEKDFLEQLDDFNTTFDGTYPNISAWVEKKQRGGFSSMKEFVLEKFGITITANKEVDGQNKKVISFCLFNPYFKQGVAYNKSKKEIFELRKPPHFYGKVLNNAIESYKHYMPDWVIRLYVDDTIPFAGNIGTPAETQAAITNLQNYANGEVYTINFQKIHKKIAMGHLGLIPVIFRFLPYFDENVTTCFIGDADNYCSFLMKDVLEKFHASDSKLLIFKTALGYARISPEYPDKKDCIENFLAGMFGFKKEQGEILNPNIWLDLFIFMDFYYKKMYIDSPLNETTTTHTKNYVAMCSLAVKIPDSPFFYGFEELALTYIFPLYINKFNINVFMIPIYFDWWQNKNTFIPIEINHNPFKNVTKDYKDFLTTFLLATIKDISIFSSDNYYRLAFSEFNYPVMFLAYSFSAYFALNNIDTITFNEKQIQIFIDKNKFIEELAILPFGKLYPVDFGETENGTAATLNFIFGENAQNELMNILYQFEASPLDLVKMKRLYDDLYNRAKIKVTSNVDRFSYSNAQKELVQNIKESMIISRTNPIEGMDPVVIGGGPSVIGTTAPVPWNKEYSDPPLSPQGGPRKSRKQRKQRKNRKNRTYKK